MIRRAQLLNSPNVGDAHALTRKKGWLHNHIQTTKAQKPEKGLETARLDSGTHKSMYSEFWDKTVQHVSIKLSSRPSSVL